MKSDADLHEQSLVFNEDTVGGRERAAKDEERHCEGANRDQLLKIAW